MTAATVRAPHGLAIGLFLLVWLSGAWFGSEEFNPNNSTRLFAAISLAEQHDATIDEFAKLTIDEAKFGDHVYLDKAPGMTLMATPLVWLTDLVTGDRAANHKMDLYDDGLTGFMRLRLRVVTTLTVALLTALAAVLLLDMATGVTGSPAAGLVAALAYAMATPVWGFSTTMFGHAPVAALLLIAVWAIWRGTSGAKEETRLRYPVMAGAALGWAMVIELQAALPGLIVGLWAIWRTRAMPLSIRARILGIAALTGLFALLPMALYNYFVFGSLFRVGYQGVVGFNGMNQGLFGLTWPKPEVIFALIAGLRRGLLWVAPILILAPFGRMIRAAETRDLGWLVLAAAIVMLLYNASYYYWDGGDSTGPRHLLPALGLLALPLACLWARLGKIARRAMAALLGVSMAIDLAIAATDIVAPDTYAFPLGERILPLLLADKVRTIPSQFWGWPGWLGLITYLLIALPLLWWLVRQASKEPVHG